MKMLPLLLDRHILVVDPAPAVADHVIVRRLNRLDHLGMTRQRHGDAKHGQRQSPLAELIMDAPETGAAAVLIQRIHRHMPVRVAGGADNIGQKLLRTGIAVQHVVFRALFVVQNKLHGDARIVRPPRVRRLSAVAAQVARVIVCQKCHLLPLHIKRDLMPEICRSTPWLPETLNRPACWSTGLTPPATQPF